MHVMIKALPFDFVYKRFLGICVHNTDYHKEEFYLVSDIM
jgi:hypothetical protein